jgi:hypothetical protein
LQPGAEFSSRNYWNTSTGAPYGTRTRVSAVKGTRIGILASACVHGCADKA